MRRVPRLDRRWLRDRLAGPARLVNHPRLARLAPRLRDPRLWHLGRRTVALGSAIGICCGILVPIGQIPLAVVAALVLRANLATAVVGTFITNGFTYIPVYALAYWIGTVLTGADTLAWASDAQARGGLRGLIDVLANLPRPWASLGLPLAVGVFVLAVLAALVTYVCVSGSWTFRVRRAWNRRRSRDIR